MRALSSSYRIKNAADADVLGAGPRPTHEEFLENLGAAAHALKDTLPSVLEFIAGKTISEL